MSAESSVAPAAAHGWSLLRRASRGAQIAAFTTILAVLAIGGLAVFVAPMEALPAPVAVPWLVLALAFYITETKVIQVPFRRETHALSLSEVPTVIALLFAHPYEYVAALLIGAGIGLVVARQPFLKLAFNLAQYLLGAVVALVVFRLLAGPFDVLGPQQWMAALTAVVVTSILSVTAIATAITLSGAAPQFQRLPQMLQVSVAVAVVNTWVGLLGADMMWENPAKLALLLVPVAILFVAYQAYITERRKHESLELLYESSLVFQRSPELESAIVTLLRHARDMFNVDRAELLMFPADGSLLRTAVGPGELEEIMKPAPDSEQLAVRLQTEATAFAFVPDLASSGADRLYPNGMVAPLHGESSVIGALLVANRVGEDDSFAPDELRLLQTIANQAATALENTQLEQSLAELSRLKEELRELAFYDPLTGLANRVLFREEVEARLMGVPDAPTIVLFLDLDDFKVVNDSLGHAAGDELLVDVGARLRESIGADDVPARLGGDEFAVLIAPGRDIDEALDVSRRIIQRMRQPFEIGGREFVVGTSVGIAGGTSGEVTAEQLMRNADVAMYSAKVRDRGGAATYDPEMHAVAIQRHELRADLSRALRQTGLDVAYQPIVAMGSGRVVGFEALARWNHPHRGPISPAMFIPLAEEDGSIVELGTEMLRRATREIAAVTAAGNVDDLSVSVNVSPYQMRAANFVDIVLSAALESGLAPNRIIIEITETAMFRDVAAAGEVLQQLRAAGIRVAIDDFGTGYSSLGYLRQFPVDVLKIDREFVSGQRAATDSVLCQAMVALGHALGIVVVAEGIESMEQHAALQALGCDLGQGYLYSKPVAAGNLAAIVAAIEDRTAGRAYLERPVSDLARSPGGWAPGR